MQTHLTTEFHPGVTARSVDTGRRLRARRGAQRGQTIVIALLVLILLAFLGGLFATIVTRNLAHATRSNRVQSADYYAEAGVRFADEQLTDSLDGADWRPALQNQLDPAYQPKDPIGLARYNAAVTNLTLAPVPANDPDHDYLAQGFTRYNIGGGRYLLRVTYDPVGINNPNNTGAANTPYSDPRSRYIKIESVGREGTVDSSDPTTYRNSPRTQLNATLIQYKAIGITDYGRFETNPDNRSDIMSLGVSSAQDATGNIVTPGVYDFNGGANTLNQYPIVTTYGASDAYLTSGGQLLPNPDAGAGATGSTDVAGGGSIHVNGNVRFYGVNDFYLDNDNTATSDVFNDTVEVAGNLLLDNYTPPATGATTENLSTGQNAAVVVEPAPGNTIGPPDYVAPSNDPLGFDTHTGKVRDGNGGNDNNGEPRSVNRLDPPSLDTVNPVTNLPRYASITENSPLRATEDSVANGSPAPYAPTVPGTNAALYGYGQSIYVDNTTDIQPESSSLVGGYTLIDEWLHRAGADSGAGSKSGWVANYYRPPGVDITLGRQQTGLNDSSGNPTSFYGVRLTRTDVDGTGNLIGWKDPNGNPINGMDNDGTTRSTMTVSYKALNASNDLTAAGTVNPLNPNNDVIIYAAGNVRVHGIVSADPNDKDATTYGQTNDDDHLPRHVTIVTNGTAYIDGSLLRGNPRSSITILAHDYVCVNTTQFLAGTTVNANPAGTSQPGAFVGDPTLRALDFAASDEELLQEFNLLDATHDANPYLYVSGGPGAPGGTAVDFDILNPRLPYNTEGLGGNPPFLNPGLYPAAFAIAAAPTLSFGLSYDTTGTDATDVTRTTVSLGSVLTPGIQSQYYQLAVRRDQGGDASLNTQDFLLERAAVLPMDIRIEAVLFAQTRSFFVIPGDWFNSDSDDNVLNYQRSSGASRPGVNAAIDSQNRFPFFGQPIDMKITIDGAVSEARPAEITAQSAWMAKWGWIPQFHGGLVTGAATTEPSGHPNAASNTPGIGLQIIYNPLAGYPYYTDANSNANSDYLRTDIYGRPLPYTPKLPVCTGLLYAGQNTGQSVLQ